MVHCWKDYQEWIEETTGKPWYEQYDSLKYEHGATCHLPDGHGGPHEWTPDNEIMIEFKGGE